MDRADLADLNAFAAVAREGSFTKAAALLNVSQSALSHTVRRLEERLGVRLLSRTTRSVAPTDAGERLLQTLEPALDAIDSELASLSTLRDVPSGRIRINTSSNAAHYVLWPKLVDFLREYPEVSVELATDSGFADIVEGRFDAGVRLGEAVDKDMIATRIGPDMRLVLIASPDYLKGRSIPETPEELADHQCIGMRLKSAGTIYAWELAKDGRQVNVRVEGQLVFDHTTFIIKAALDGFGIGFVMENDVEDHISAGRLVRIMDDWCQPFSGYHLYYPSRRQPSAAFKLLVERLRHRT